MKTKLKNFWSTIRGRKSPVQSTNPLDLQHGSETLDTPSPEISVTPITLEKYQFMKLPEYVGQWWINPNFVVSVEKKPNFFHRYMTTLILGWKYVHFSK